VLISVGLVFGPDLLRDDVPPTVAVADPSAIPVVADKDVLNASTRDPATPAGNKIAGDESEEGRGKGAHTDAMKPATAVLRLDRGLDEPFELSVHMDRNREATVMQVYNDMLIVSSLYGDAELKDGSNAEVDFPGRDFSEFDGIAVEVEVDRMPELISALNRMAADQAYGNFVVPHDLRQSIELNTETVRELQGLMPKEPSMSEGGRGGPPPAFGARGYLPADIQRDCLEQELRDQPEGLRRLEAFDDREQRIHQAAKAAATTKASGRKVKLVLRLR
jgi:hypothetical protein